MDDKDRVVRPWEDLRSTGLLWLINSTVFHPRGFALAFTMQDGKPTGWKLLGDGSEPWRFDGDIDELFRKAEETLASHRIEADPLGPVIAYVARDPKTGKEFAYMPEEIMLVRHAKD